MENAAEALKSAAAVLLFVMALSVAMVMITKARVTSKAVIDLTDKTNYYEYISAEEDKGIVGMETIIPTLYKYYKEDYAVVFRNQNGNPLPIYLSTIEKKYWNKEYLEEITRQNGKDIYGDYLNSTNCMVVCSFDLEAEAKRNEPWTKGAQRDKTIEKNLDMFISGGKFILPSNANQSIDYSTNVYGIFYNKYRNSKFKQSIGRIQEKETMGEMVSSLDSKKIIYYTLVN